MIQTPLILATTLPFLGELVALLVAAAVIAYICNRLRIVPIVGFLLAGVLVGPHALKLIRGEELIGALAEIGVILLLFTIGIEFSLERLTALKTVIFAGGTIQVVLTAALVTIVLCLFGVDLRSGIFTGCLVALSSTAIVLKILADRREAHTPAGEASLGILLFQDLAVIVMVLMIPMLAGAAGGLGMIGWSLAKAAVLITVVLVVARRVMPWLLEIIARTCSAEIFLLSVIAVCLGTAYLSSLAGVSLALGAFLAGLVVSESKFRHHAISEIMPLQILFSATFFVSVGLLLDLRFIMAHPLLVSAVVMGILVVKIFTGAASVWMLRRPAAVAAWCGFLLAQVGEFSFVLQRSAAESGLYPAGSKTAGPAAFIAASVLLMLASPLLAAAGARVNRRLARREEVGERAPAPVVGAPAADSRAPAAVTAPAPALQAAEAARGDGEVELENHVILDGYGDVAKLLTPILRDAKVPVVVITLSPQGAVEAEAQKVVVVRGATSRLASLQQAGVRRARMIVVADDDAETTERAVALARQTNADAQVVARAVDDRAGEKAIEEGAQIVVADTRSSAGEILRQILHAYEVPQEQIEDYIDDVRAVPRHVVKQQSKEDLEGANMSQVCTHTNQIKDLAARTPEGCEECLKMGDTWVHLRLCRICGHVGCCDSSKNKHATKHFHATKHPIVKSYEPGEDWSWCYVDETFL